MNAVQRGIRSKKFDVMGGETEKNYSNSKNYLMRAGDPHQSNGGTPIEILSLLIWTVNTELLFEYGKLNSHFSGNFWGPASLILFR